MAPTEPQTDTSEPKLILRHVSCNETQATQHAPTTRVDGQVADQIVPSTYPMTKKMIHNAKSTNTNILSSFVANNRSKF